MVEEWKPKDVDSRFGTYVEELRDFFLSRRLQAGSPQDLTALVARLASSAGFAEEMESMVRSIVFSEGEHLRRGDLLVLVAVAAGGSEVDPQQPEVAEAARTLQGFLDTATRQQWAMFAPPAEVDETAGVESALGGEFRDELRELPPVITAGEILAAENPQAREPSVAERRYSSLSEEPEREPSWRPPAVPQSPQDADPARTGRREASSAHAGPFAPDPFRPNPFASDPFPPGALRSGFPPSPAHHGNEVLFRAVRMAAAQKSEAPQRGGWRSTLSQWWSIPAAALALVAIAVGVVTGRAQWAHQHPATASPGLLSPAVAGERAGSCVASPGPGVSRSGLEERSRWAHSLLEQKLYGSALPELRTIAHLDPGYPAIQLDQSDALLSLRRPDEARVAVDEQITIAECLARLPPSALDAYCVTQYGPAVQSACRPQLEHIRQAAQLQAALVHLELGHRLAATGGGTAAAVAELRQSEADTNTAPPVPPAEAHPAAVRQKRQAPLPPASEDDTAQPAISHPQAEPR